MNWTFTLELKKRFFIQLSKNTRRRVTYPEVYEEHALVKQLLEELASAPKDDEQWTANFTVLKENVEHHVEEEEGEVFQRP